MKYCKIEKTLMKNCEILNTQLSNLPETFDPFSRNAVFILAEIKRKINFHDENKICNYLNNI